VQYHSAPHFY
jgi:hypothetical protein